MTIYNPIQKEDILSKKLFFDEPVNIQRYDVLKYPWIDKLTDKQLGFFWRPDEVNLQADSKDFKSLTDYEQHIFTSNLKRQIVLDSVQGRAPCAAFGPIVSNSELETFITTWQFFETIHSRAYTHIIRNVYPDPSVIFDEINSITEIVDCAHDISMYYDNLMEGTPYNWARQPSLLNLNKEALWRALMAANALEGIRFYVSFACSWAFAELKKMEGNAKIIKLICRDENLHLAATQQILKTLPKDDPEFERIKNDLKDECTKMFISVVDQEKKWAKYLFKDGSMIGLNEKILCEYLEWLAHKRMTAVGLDSPYVGGPNPLPWTQKWISGADIQVAPQETEITSYIIGGIKNDFNEEALKGFKL